MSDGMSDSITLVASSSAIMLATSASSNPFDVLPLSAGVSASMISVFRGRSLKEPATRMQLALSFMSGVSSVLFIAPMFCKHVLSIVWPEMDVETRTFIYLVFGLIGSTLIDLILEKRKKMSENIAETLFKNWKINQMTSPAIEYKPEAISDAPKAIEDQPINPS